MSAIFLSHSSDDKDRAAAVKRWLEAQGHSVFLDSDPKSGIVGGADWEKTLYQRLYVCQAVVPLLSANWVASKWCFAELVHARAVGKTIVPVRIGPGERAFDSIQEIDLTGDSDSGYEQLRLALHEVFPWDPERAPYPGLAAYEEKDAPVFVGRDPEIRDALEQLESMQRRGRFAPRLLVVLGASGSGKSSLVKAGLVPRLCKNERDWLVVPSFRPRANPLDELAMALATAYGDAGQPRDWRQLKRDLLAGAAAAPLASTYLLDVARELRAYRRRPQATMLLVVDQAEELFSARDSAAAAACLGVMRSALERADSELIAVATVRSDFLGAFQRHAFLQEADGSPPLPYERFALDPMPASRISEIIHKPAMRAGLKVDNELGQQLERDIRDLAVANRSPGATGREDPSIDALPLLAFTLRRLWDTEEFRADNQLSLDEYVTLGGVDGAVATVANETLDDPSVTPEALADLRAAIIPGLVGVTAAGVRSRRRAPLASMPAGSRPLLARLVEARLLSTDRDAEGVETIEVAHEALFRMWPRLARWLDEDQDKLRLVEGIRQAAAEWEARRRSPDLLVHRDGRLVEVLRLLEDEADRRFGSSLDATDTAYVQACRTAQEQRDEAARAEQERKLDDARTIARQRGIVLGVVAFFAVALVAALILVLNSKSLAQDQSRLVLADHLNERDPTRAGLVLLELARPQKLFPLRAAALEVLSHPLALDELRHRDTVVWTDVSADGRLVVTASRDGTARIWRPGSGQPAVELRQPDEVLRAVLSPNGELLATATMNNGARLWTTDGRAVTPELPHNGVVSDLAFSPEGDRLVTGTFLGGVRVWSTAGPSPPTILGPAEPDTEVVRVSFDGSGARVLAAYGNGKVRLWDLTGAGSREPLQCDYGRQLVTAAIAADKRTVLTVARSGEVFEWTPAAGDPPCPVVPLIEPVAPPSDAQTPSKARSIAGAVFDATGSHLAILQDDGAIDWWTRPFGSKHVLLPSPGVDASTATFAGGGQQLLAGYADGTSRWWRRQGSERPALLLAGHDGTVRRVAVDRASRLAVTASEDGTVRLWEVSDETNTDEPGRRTLRHSRNVTDVDVSRDGKLVLTASQRGEVTVWSLDGERLFKASVDVTVLHAAISPGGDRILAVAGGRVRVWRLPPLKPGAGPHRVATGDRPWKPAVDQTILFAAFSPDGRRLVATSEDGRGWIWTLDRPADAPIELSGHDRTKSVTAAAFDPAGELVATASDDGTARLWSATRHAPAAMTWVHGAGVQVRTVAFSSDGRSVLTAASDGVARLWRVGSEKASRTFPHDSPLTVATFSRDGQRVLTASEDGMARIWRLQGDRAVELLERQSRREIVSGEFSDDGMLVLTASKDGRARVWRASGSDDPLVLVAGTKALARATFTPDDSRVVTGSADGKAKIFTIDPAQLLDTIRAQTRLCLQPELRRRYFLESASAAAASFQACEKAVSERTAPP